MTDHPRYRVVCHCRQHSCPYRNHRKYSATSASYSTLGVWATWYALGVIFFIMSVFVDVPSGIFWSVYAAFILGALALLFPPRAGWRRLCHVDGNEQGADTAKGR